jgi:hypothetical protein
VRRIVLIVSIRSNENLPDAWSKEIAFILISANIGRSRVLLGFEP